MNDLISRQAAIGRIESEYRKWGDEYDVRQILGDLEDMPSAEPERKKPDHGYMWICPECGLEVHSDFRRCVRCGWDRPSAEPEQKKGKWIPIYYDNKAMFYQCPYCGARYMLQTRFCGNCGKVVYHE